MANNHAHGAFGAQLIGNRNLTPHTSQFSFTPSSDVAEDTPLSAPGDAKTFLQGPRGAAASSSGYAVNDYEFMVSQMQNLTGALRLTEPLTQAPFGFTPGYFQIMSNARKTSFNVPVSNASTITTSFNHQLDSEWWLGWSLFNPFGASAYSGGEVQALTFTAADANQFFALRAVDTTQTFAFQAGDSNATLKAGIEALAAYTGLTVTVAGSLTGTTTLTGTKTFSFSGTTNVPQLEVLTGAVDSFVVTGGGSGNYTLNGGANFTLGVTESTLQSNQRTLGGQYAAVVVKGTSAAPATGTLTFDVSGAGDATFNGHYTDGGTYNSKRYYTNGTTYYYSDSLINTWMLSTTLGGPGSSRCSYYTGGSGSTPPTGATTADLGTAPPPTIAAGTPSASTDGSASFTLYYPVAATPSAPTKTGTGAVVSRVFARNSLATTITETTTIQGGTQPAIWNLQTTAATGTVHDGGATTTTGFYGRMQVPLAAGTAFVALIEHSDSSGSGYTTLCTFNSVTDPSNPALTSQEFIGAAGATVKRYVRARITTCTGTFAAFIGYARKS